jgi:hypothetical protein
VGELILCIGAILALFAYMGAVLSRGKNLILPITVVAVLLSVAALGIVGSDGLNGFDNWFAHAGSWLLGNVGWPALACLGGLALVCFMSRLTRRR